MTSKGPSSLNCFVILWLIIQVNLPGVATAGDKRQDNFNFKALNETLSWKCCFEFSHPSCHRKLTAPVFFQLTSNKQLSPRLISDQHQHMAVQNGSLLQTRNYFSLPLWLHCNCEKLSDKICCSMGRGFIHLPTDRNKPTVYSKLSLWLALFYLIHFTSSSLLPLLRNSR